MGREYKLKVDTAQLVRAYELAPERLEKALRLQLKMAARDIKEYAAEHHRYTSRSGALEDRGIVTYVFDDTALIALSSNVPYGPIVHEGIETPYVIVPSRPGKKKALRWTVGSGRTSGFAFAKRVVHPAVPADPFLYQAADHELPNIQSRFDAAIEDVLRGL